MIISRALSLALSAFQLFLRRRPGSRVLSEKTIIARIFNLESRKCNYFFFFVIRYRENYGNTSGVGIKIHVVRSLVVPAESCPTIVKNRYFSRRKLFSRRLAASHGSRRVSFFPHPSRSATSRSSRWPAHVNSSPASGLGDFWFQKLYSNVRSKKKNKNALKRTIFFSFSSTVLLRYTGIRAIT